MFHIDFISYFVKIIIDNVYIQKLDSLPNKYSVRLQVLNFLMEAFVMSFYNRFFEIIEGSFDFPIDPINFSSKLNFPYRRKIVWK